MQQKQFHGLWTVSYTHLDVYKRQMYACDKEARKIYLEEAMNAFNYVLDELCHGTGSAANCDFDVEE